LSISLVAVAQPLSDVRSIDGTDNNLSNFAWGAAEAALPRVTGAYYPGDGSGTTFYGGPGSSAQLPNPRDISNKLYATHGKSPTSKRL
jgi:hypothetical protein